MKRYQIDAQRGITLLEVLVTLVLFAVGLLGLAALQGRAQQAEMESFQRTQALALVHDMVNRISVNRQVAAGCYANALVQNDTATSTCGDATADDDLADWGTLLSGATETLSGNSVGTALGARGCIVFDGTDTYTVTVAWQGLTQVPLPNGASNCGQGSYGTEDATGSFRRVMSTSIRIANLTAP